MSEEKEPKTSNNTIIKDPKIEPYFISKDAYCYTIYKNVIPDIKYTEDNKPGKEYQKPIGHYSSFASCLRALAKEKLDNKQHYESIKDYIQTFKNLETSIKELLNVIE
jgi:hypothetical protein